jgi:hypothetical protein
MTPAPSSSRRHALALALAGPAIVAAIVIIAVESYRVVQPDSILFAEPPASSFAEALMNREVELAYAFVHNGTDPNAMLVVQDVGLTGGRRVEVSPLMLAVAAKNRNAVMMLLSAGVDVDLPANQPSACLAQELGEHDLETMILRGSRAPARPPCDPTIDGGTPPLLRYRVVTVLSNVAR